MIPFFIPLLLFFSIVISPLFSDDSSIEILSLKNGMKVLLKHTDYEEDEVAFKMIAPGGFTSVPDYRRASAELAPLIAWESGLGTYTSDKLSAVFWEQSIEATIKVSPYSRVIDGVTSPEGLETLLKALTLFFTEAKFTERGFQTIVTRIKEDIRRYNEDCGNTFEDQYKAINSENFSALRPLNLNDLAHVDFDDARRFHHHAFSNPREFVLTIVGNFDKGSIKPLLEKTLEKIPPTSHFLEVNDLAIPRFPEGIISKNLYSPSARDSLTRLTLPLSMEINQENIELLEVLTQLMMIRLQNKITNQMHHSFGVNVAYEFPMFPLLSRPWISIQFSCPPLVKGPLRKLIISELSQLQEKGPSEEELMRLEQQLKTDQNSFPKDNDFWIAVISSYYSWGWEPTGIIKPKSKNQYSNELKIKEVLKTAYNVKNYTIISVKPK